MLSHDGPKAAVADINGDGLDDIYIGGTIAKQGQLYLQNSSGGFIKKEALAFKKYTGLRASDYKSSLRAKANGLYRTMSHKMAV